MNGRTNSSGSSVNDLQIPLDPCTNLECVAGNAQVELTWTDPLNKYATPEGEVAEDPDQLVSVWHHTVVIRKVGSAPVGIDDGIVVVSSEVKNQYQSTAYIDTGLVNDTTYYYGVFAINEDGVESEGLVSEGVTPKLGTPLSELAEGTIIKINENGAPVEFYLAKHNYEPDLNGPGRELLVRKDCWAALQEWQPSSSINDYNGSKCDALSKSYSNNVFDDYVKEIIGTTKFRYTEMGVGVTRLTTIERTSFSLSGTEMGFSHDDLNIEGSAIPIASSIRIANYLGEPHRWSLRSPDINNWNFCFAINKNGQLSTPPIRVDVGAGFTDSSIRPAFTLPDSTMFDAQLNLLIIT